MNLTAEQQLRLDQLTTREHDSITAAEMAGLNFLRTLASAEPAAEDAPAEEAPAEEVPAEEPAAPEAAAPVKMKQSIFKIAEDRIRSRTALLADLSGARDQLAAMTAERDALAAQVADLTNRATAGEAFAARVAELESERCTVGQAAARIAASAHVAPEALPETSDNVETLDGIRAQINSTTDPKERSRLATKARALRDAPVSSMN